MNVKHGGNLLEITALYGGDVEEWVDLSTGVSPFTYPVGDIPERVWNQLPQINDGLEVAAKRYYNTSVEPLAVSGSQAAIMQLPAIASGRLRGTCGVVALPRVGYKEHEKAWRTFTNNGLNWQVLFYEGFPELDLVKQCDVIVVINPNNPTGENLNKTALQELYQALVDKGSLLVVDEAFADIPCENSLLDPKTDFSGLIVLRSVGKFFGLAGARVGFVFATEHIKAEFNELLGPWTVTGPSRWVMKQALADQEWQQGTTKKIQQASHRLMSLLQDTFALPCSGTELFTTLYTEHAVDYHRQLCQQNIYTRLCDEQNAIRFGLPANEAQWLQLESGLKLLNLFENQR